MSTFRKIDVAGLKIDAATKSEMIAEVAARISRKEKTFMVTPYSEFLYASMRNYNTEKLLNSADFAIPDGIGIFWAHKFMSQPLTVRGFYSKILQAWWQVVWTGASIIFKPRSLYTDIPEKIVGADLAWDLAELAADNNFTVYILGGFDNTDKVVAQKFKEKFPNINIVGTSNKHASDPSILENIREAKPDILLVGLGKITQEKWISDHLHSLPATFAIGLGGTFDYIAGVRRKPPRLIRNIGLEWLYRLITQPHRVKRIFEATWGLIISLVRIKVFGSMPLRVSNSVVVKRKDGKILLCKQAKPLTEKFYPHKPGYVFWQFPQGGLEKGEDTITGAKRELQEETGITSVRPLGVAKYERKYPWRNALRPFLTSHYKASGGHLITAFFEFDGTDEEIKLDQYELEDFRWMEPSEVLQTIATEKKEHAQAVLAELAKIQV